MDDDAKKIIMARRARFLAAALAGIAAPACGKTTAPPDAGHEVGPTSTDPPPQPCLSVAIQRDAGSPDASGMPPTQPQVCLKPQLPPRDR